MIAQESEKTSNPIPTQTLESSRFFADFFKLCLLKNDHALIEQPSITLKAKPKTSFKFLIPWEFFNKRVPERTYLGKHTAITI